MVLGGSETCLLQLALDISLLLYFGIVCEHLQLRGSRGGVLPGYGWVENRTVQISWLRDQRWIIFSTIGAEYLLRYNFHCTKIIVQI